MNNFPNTLNPPESTLCTGCASFFANPQFAGLCSKCYGQNSQVAKTAMPPQTLDVAPLPSSDQSEKLSQLKKPKDLEHCGNCQKTLGIYGFLCKCEAMYCKKHRLPESHQCSYDFAAEGRKQLQKNNPIVAKEKIEKI